MRICLLLSVFTVSIAPKFFCQELYNTSQDPISKPCTREFVFNYRVIYDDTTGTEEEFLNRILPRRFHIDAYYIQGNLNDPENLFIGADHYDHPEWIIENRLCFFEKLNQTGNIKAYIEEVYSE